MPKQPHQSNNTQLTKQTQIKTITNIRQTKTQRKESKSTHKEDHKETQQTPSKKYNRANLKETIKKQINPN